jgi:PEP-CTERM motif
VRHQSLILIAALALVPSFARAGDLVFTQDFDAQFQFNVFNPSTGVPTGWVDYEAAGALTFTIGSAITDPSQTTVPILNVTGTLESVFPSPVLGPYSISPNVAFLGGELTNIERDGSGNLISANVSDLAMQWSLTAPGVPVYVFTADAGGLPFDGAITSLPFSYGTVLSGAAQFNVYADEGGTNVVVAYGRDRTLTAVPEPSSIALLGIGVLGLYAYGRRARRESRQALGRAREPRPLHLR